MAELIRIARSRKLTQASAARLLGVSQPRVSDLMCAKVDKFSSDALVEMFAMAGIELQVTRRARHSRLRLRASSPLSSR